MKKCLDCGKKLSNNPKAKRCKPCSLKGKLNPSYKNGLYLKENRCIICGKKVSRGGIKKCIKCNAKLIKINYTGKGNPFFNKTHTKKYINKLKKIMLGKNNPNYNNHKIAGKNHFNWRGGISKLPYSFEFTKELKESIRKRDKRICQLCFKNGKTIHHIDYNKQNNKEKNLINLCNKCNTKVNFLRTYWKKFFKQVIRFIYDN